MFFTSLLNAAVITDEVAEGSIVIVPAENGTWHSANLVIPREDWDAMFVQYRSKEPEVEQVMHAIMGSSGKSNSAVIEFLGGLGAVRNRYTELAMPAEEASLQEETTTPGVEDSAPEEAFASECATPEASETVEPTTSISEDEAPVEEGSAEEDYTPPVIEGFGFVGPAQPSMDEAYSVPYTATEEPAEPEGEEYEGPQIPGGLLDFSDNIPATVETHSPAPASEPEAQGAEEAEEYDPLAGRDDIFASLSDRTPTAGVASSPATTIVAPTVETLLNAEDEDDLFGDPVTGLPVTNVVTAPVVALVNEATTEPVFPSAPTPTVGPEEPDLGDILAQLETLRPEAHEGEEEGASLQDVLREISPNTFDESNICANILEGAEIAEVSVPNSGECTAAFREVYATYAQLFEKHTIQRICFMNGMQVEDLQNKLNNLLKDTDCTLTEYDLATNEAFLRTVNKCYWAAISHVLDSDMQEASTILSALADLIFTR